jgi:hypothetical protein
VKEGRVREGGEGEDEEEEEEEEEMRAERVEREKVKRRSMLQGLRIRRNSFLMSHFEAVDEGEDGEDEGEDGWDDMEGGGEMDQLAWERIDRLMGEEGEGGSYDESGSQGESGRDASNASNAAGLRGGRGGRGGGRGGRKRANRRSSQRQAATVTSMSVLVESLEESHLRNLRVLAEAKEHSKRKLARRREAQQKKQQQEQQRTMRRKQRASVAMLQMDAAAHAKSMEKRRIKEGSVRIMNTLKYGWADTDEDASTTVSKHRTGKSSTSNGSAGAASGGPATGLRAQAGAAYDEYEYGGSSSASGYGDVNSDVNRRKRATRHWVLPEECESEMRQLLMLLLMEAPRGGGGSDEDGIVRLLNLEQVHAALELFGIAPATNSMMAQIRQQMQEQSWQRQQQRRFDREQYGDGENEDELYEDEDEDEGLIGIEELMRILIPACGTAVDMGEMESLFRCYDDCEPETTTRVLEGEGGLQQELTAETSVRVGLSTLQHVLCGVAPSLGRPLTSTTARGLQHTAAIATAIEGDEGGEYEQLMIELAAHAPGLLQETGEHCFDGDFEGVHEGKSFDVAAATASGTVNLLDYMRDVTAGYAPVA